MRRRWLPPTIVWARERLKNINDFHLAACTGDVEFLILWTFTGSPSSSLAKSSQDFFFSQNGKFIHLPTATLYTMKVECGNRWDFHYCLRQVHTSAAENPRVFWCVEEETQSSSSESKIQYLSCLLHSTFRAYHVHNIVECLSHFTFTPTSRSSSFSSAEERGDGRARWCASESN